MTPNEAREWLELLRTNPLLVIAAFWAIVEARRFARELVEHLRRVEAKLDQIGHAVDARDPKPRP